MGFDSALSPLAEFGENYPQFYHKGAQAVEHLLKTKSGQVVGAYEKQGLGDIDLVWGNKDFGLEHIIAKHEGDFKDLSQELSEIIAKGEVKQDNNVLSIIYHKDGQTYRLGLSKGFRGEGENKWIITAYKVDKSPAPDFLPSKQIAKDDGTNLRPNDLVDNSTTKIFDMSQTSVDSLEDFKKWSEFVGVRFGDEAQAKEAHQFILANKHLIECD